VLRTEFKTGRLIYWLNKVTIFNLITMETKTSNPKNIADKEQMKTLSSCINTLTTAGYETQFKIEKGLNLKSLTTENIYHPEDVKINSFYRFEGESDPADNSILYAIETNTGERGTLTDAYGVYNDALISAFINQVEEIEKKAHTHEFVKKE
jgi:hypothetical protein